MIQKLLTKEQTSLYEIGCTFYFCRKVNNMIEAAYQGANQSIKLVANICIQVMAFLAILKFLNNTLTWFGDRAGVDELTFEVRRLPICIKKNTTKNYSFYHMTSRLGVK